MGPEDKASPQGGTQPPRDRRIPHSKPKSLEESLFRLGEHSGGPEWAEKQKVGREAGGGNAKVRSTEKN